jgi:hypothetical protein
MSIFISPDKRLYDYTRALASGISLSDGTVRSFLPKLYLENKNISAELAPLVYEGDVPDRYPQAYEDALDRIGRAFGIFRGPNETDDAFRQKIKLRIIQSPTLSGISNSIKTVFFGLNLDVNVQSVNAFTDSFTAVDNNFNTSLRGTLGARSYRIIIEITPAFKYAFPKFVDVIPSGGAFYRVKKSGYHTLILDRFGEFLENSGNIKIFVKNTQIPTIPPSTFSSESVTPGTEIELGFLTTFQEIGILRNDEFFDNSYLSWLVFNNREFDFYKNPAYNGLLAAFGVNFLREIFQNTLSYGIIIERIIVRQSGSGG